jgi:epoxyqueuosine reductase
MRPGKSTTTWASPTPSASAITEWRADDRQRLTDRLKQEAARLGFDALGVAPAVAPPGYPRYLDWLARGHAAGMGYLHRQAEARSDPAHLLEGVRSVIMGAFVYGGPDDEGPAGETSGKVARYARGDDYHEVLWRRLERLFGWLQNERPGVRGRAVADTAPLLERDYAQLAGLGWIGKSTMLIGKRLGTYTVLGALLVDIELAYDTPHTANHCGTCTRCLDACPTDAFTGPYQLDATRCISYWTIEHRGTIPDPMASSLDGWAFGCDICQEVCPWNRKAPAATEPALRPRPGASPVDLIAWLESYPDAFRRAIRGTALSRARRTGLLRNAALILGTRRAHRAIPALAGLLHDPDPIVRASCAWALGAIGGGEARKALANSLNDEDPAVRDAVRQALDHREPPEGAS